MQSRIGMYRFRSNRLLSSVSGQRNVFFLPQGNWNYSAGYFKNANFHSQADHENQYHRQCDGNSNHKRDHFDFPFNQIALFAAFAAAVTLSTIGTSKSEANKGSDSKATASSTTTTIYTLDEVSKHKTKSTGVWVVYNDGVYDITNFIANHPGGQDKIMLAAGSDIAPFWNLYRQHFNSPTAMEILQKHRIGTLAQEDVLRMQANRSPADANDPYGQDPALSPVLRYISRKPINAEPPLSLLTDSWITPTELWFVRNHHPVVHVPDASKHKLVVDWDTSIVRNDKSNSISSSSTNNDNNSGSTGNRSTELTLSVQDLKTRFKAHTVVATLQCGGNRRAEMSDIERTNGSNWSAAISTAKWKGVRLRDVLIAAGVTDTSNDDDEDEVEVEQGNVEKSYRRSRSAKIKYVHFIGADNMQASIPIRKALSKEGDVLIAYEMNDAPIPAQFG